MKELTTQDIIQLVQEMKSAYEWLNQLPDDVDLANDLEGAIDDLRYEALRLSDMAKVTLEDSRFE